ncbi:hypothetical protein [Geoglobus acetivorans]|uniref:Putative membrane protein n=1 Tax=Geoglobus acetivorans TaxID=565033 RepID=A0A0A7GDE7_GEOAI|nr:putative membrane protein [Geoglobus acetivorans]
MEDIRAELEQRVAEESRINAVARWIYRHSRAVFSFIAVLFTFSVFFLFNPEYTAQGLGAFGELLGQLHAELAEKRFSVYQLAALMVFLAFMTLMVIESARARTIRIISARNPEHELYVRVKPLIGVKLPFVPERRKIKPMIVETEYGYIVYPSKSLLNAQWNGEKHFIPKHAKLSFGNVWVVAAKLPDRPSWVEKIETAKGTVDVDFYQWEFDPLGNLLAERAQKEIETLRNTLETIEKQLEQGWKLASKIATEPEEFFDRIKEKERRRTVEIIDVVGSTVFKEITQTIRQAYRYAQATQKREKEAEDFT